MPGFPEDNMGRFLQHVGAHRLSIVTAIIISGMITAAINSTLVLLLEEVRGIELSVLTPRDPFPRPVHWRQLIPESFVMPLVGVILFLLLKAYARRPWPWFIVLVAVITAVWSAGPVMQGTGVVSKLFLTLTHGVIALSIVLTIRFYLEPRTG